MKLHFLGGADEVGASCTLVELEGRRLLVDAGIRMGAPPGSQLPNFSVLDDTGPPEEVLVTHAHTDHTGALPVLAGGLPADVRIRCTPATKDITRILLSDAVKIMSHKGEQDGELPLYPPEAADVCIGKMTQVPFLSTVPICGGALSATWIPSGHILGAASIYIEGPHESILVTGDVSVANQQTIPGMVVPQCRPDVMIMESTYGNRQHADRAQQENGLAHRVAEVIEAGGKVLVPAFAVGRAQEVILILSQAMRKKQIPEFNVFVDGMVRSVNAAYAAFPDDLAPPIRRRVLKGEDPFYSEKVVPVSAPGDRDKVLSGNPCCIVASSGMLIGGASSYYAERMAPDDKNLIAITGYQDEEAPGRALLDLAQASDRADRVLMLNGNPVPVACRVETYSLSAHADSGELVSLVRRLGPQSVHLVHGDDEARSALSSELDIHLAGGVHLPVNGTAQIVETEGKKTRGYGRLVQVGGISQGRAPDGCALEEIRDHLAGMGMKGTFRVQELAEIWYGTEGMKDCNLEVFRGLVLEHGVFEADRRRPYLFHPATDEDLDSSGIMEVNAARTMIQDAFPSEAGLFRVSAHVAEEAFELAFHFPDVIEGSYAEVLTALKEKTGWEVRLRPTPHQGRLAEVALEVLPDDLRVLKSPALRLEKREIAVEIEGDLSGTGEDDVIAQFKERTGFNLILSKPGSVKQKSPGSRAGGWEINRAYEEIRQTLRDMSHAPSKMGNKVDESGDYIEVAYISPAVGERYRSVLDEVSASIGWPIRVRDSANQELIAQEARRITPGDCNVRATPKFFLAEQHIIVPVDQLPGNDLSEQLSQEFQERTGFRITWELPKSR
jgi:Cft2 family RNA processing exonuclease